MIFLPCNVLSINTHNSSSYHIINVVFANGIATKSIYDTKIQPFPLKPAIFTGKFQCRAKKVDFSLLFHSKSLPLHRLTHISLTNAGGACMKMQAFFMLVLNDIEVLLYPRGKL